MNKVNLDSDPRKIRELLQRDGYILVKNILDKATLERLISAFDLPQTKQDSGDFLKRKSIPNAVHLIPLLSDIVCEPNIVKLMNMVFDNQSYCFTSHSDIHMNNVTGWHKDDGRGLYFEGLDDYSKSDFCQVYKIGIYLQDASHSGGLTIKPGSHKTGYSKLFGLNVNSSHSELYLPSMLGDIVIFDVRITHKGDSLDKTNLLWRLLRKLGIVKEKKLDYERLSFFFTYGLQNKYTKIFAQKNMERQLRQLGSSSSKIMPAELNKKLKEAGICSYF